MADAKSALGAAASGKKTLVEEGTELRGSLVSSCPIVVRGKIQGEVTAPALTISASGGVAGTVKVGEIRSDGELAGEIDADVVQLSGTVRNNTVIRARSLEVKLESDGSTRMQVVFGECMLDVGDPPSKADAVAALMAPPVVAPPPAAALETPPAQETSANGSAASAADAGATRTASVPPAAASTDAEATSATAAAATTTAGAEAATATPANGDARRPSKHPPSGKSKGSAEAAERATESLPPLAIEDATTGGSVPPRGATGGAPDDASGSK